ncbi:MAG: FixH family protein [Myxococcota bacterium]
MGFGRDGRKAARLLALAVVALAACGSEAERPAAAPAAPATTTQSLPDGGLRAITQAGRFVITVRPEAGSIPIGPLHAWIVTVTRPDGRPAAVRQLVFDGGMPQHGHGFETAPQVTAALGEGVFRVDGVRFHMAGAWKLRIDVAEAGSADVAYLDVDVVP